MANRSARLRRSRYRHRKNQRKKPEKPRAGCAASHTSKVQEHRASDGAVPQQAVEQATRRISGTGQVNTPNEDIISSLAEELAEGAATVEARQQPRQRRCSYPTCVSLSLGVILIGTFTVSAILTSNGLGTLIANIQWAKSPTLAVAGTALVLAGIAFELWDSRRTWHRPAWRIRRELIDGLGALHLLPPNTASTPDINRYRWNPKTYSATVRLRHPGNARITFDTLQRLAQSNPFRFAHSVEVEPFLTRQKTPDGWLIHIYYRDSIETLDR